MIALEEWRKAAQFFDCAGHRIAYWSAANPDPQKPWLLLAHGFPTSSWDWQALWPELTERFDCLAPDLMGYGFSAKPRRYAYSIMDQADLLVQLMQQLQLTDVDILAHDYGDTVAQELLARQVAEQLPFQIHSICFLNGGLIPTAHRPRLIQRLLLGPLGGLVARLINYRKFKKSFLEVFGPQTEPTEAELQSFWSLIEQGQGRLIYHKLIRYIPERHQHGTRWVHALQQARLPLALIDGLLDPVSGAHLVEAYREAVPQSSVYELPGIGHYPQTEAPAKVLQAFDEFYRSNRP